LTNLQVREPVDEGADHGAEDGDGGGLDDAVYGRKEQRVRPDADHIKPHRELPHTACNTDMIRIKTWFAKPHGMDHKS
jgi:hypothetical protein